MKRRQTISTPLRTTSSPTDAGGGAAPSLHPFDEKLRRNRERRERRMEQLFGREGDHLGRDQTTLQVLAAARIEQQHREKAAHEKSLWNNPPPPQGIIPARGKR